MPKMKTIPLTKGQVATVSDIDRDLADIQWHARLRGNVWYAARHIRGTFGQKSLWMHRVILERMISRTLRANEQTDHINGNGLDNRRENLRICTPAQNRCNRGKTKANKSGYKGVCWDEKRSKWESIIRVSGKAIHLGRFSTAEEAARAYDDAATKLHGEFSNLNYKPPQQSN